MIKALTIASIILVVLCIIGGFVLLDNMFPVADPIALPETEDITSVSLAQEDDLCVSVDPSDYALLLENMKNAQPTRIMSVNDYPGISNYYIIRIETPERAYQFWAYTEDSKAYIEDPYTGVYTTNAQFLDSLAAHFE